MNKKTIVMSLLGLFVILLMSSIAQADVEVNDLSDGKVVLNINYGDLEDNEETLTNTKTLKFKNTAEPVCPSDCDSECGSECTDCNACMTDPGFLCSAECPVGEDPSLACITCLLTNYPTKCGDCISCMTTCNECTETPETVSLDLTDFSDEYTVGLSEDTLELLPGETKEVTLTITVPVNVDSGVHSVGNLKMTVDTVETDYAIETNVKSMLELEEIKVYVNGDKEDDLNNDGDDIKKVKPGSEIELRFEVENLFNDGNDAYDYGDMEVELNVVLDDDDFEDDVDEYEDFDLDTGEKLDDGEIVIEFDVPKDAKEEDFDLEIRLEGEDENGAKHVVEWTVVLKVDRERDDVQLETAKLMSETLSCGETTYLKIKVTNFGSNDQDDVALSVYNEKLGLNFNEMNIKLEDGSDDDYEYSKSILVNPGKDAEPGIYYIDVRAFIDDDNQKDEKLVKLTVDACGVTTDTTDDSSDDSSDTTSDDTSDVVVVTMPTDSVDLSSPTTAGTTLVTSETSFGDVKGAVVLMCVIVGLLVILIVLSAAILVRK